MHEITRFQVARAVQRACGVERERGIQLDRWMPSPPTGPVPIADVGAGLAADEDRATVASIAALDVPGGDALDRLDQWLTCRSNAPDPAELRAELADVLDRTLPEPTTAVPPDGDAVPALAVPAALAAGLGLAPGDPLRPTLEALATALVEATQVHTAPDRQRHLARAALIVGLIELIIVDSAPLRAVDVRWALQDRLILLPRLVPLAPLRSRLARRPGFADLFVVREEWARYEAAEVAHIENVLPHEERRREHKRTDESEVTSTDEREVSRSDEHETQTTARFELSDSTSSDTSQQAHVEGQLDTSGTYGPTTVETHLAGSLDYSQEDAQEHATKMANELVARAVQRSEERVRTQRVTRSLTRIEETNLHGFAASDAGVTGVYRWVEKVVRCQTYRYPNRFLLEFEVPEPAAYLRWIDSRRGAQGFATPEPTPFTLDGRPDSAQNSTLLPTEVSEDPNDPGYYLRLAARYHAIGIGPPPERFITVSGWVTVAAGSLAQDQSFRDVWVSPMPGATGVQGADGASIVVPEGYLAANSWSGWISAWSYPISIPAVPVVNMPAALPGRVFITVGDSANGVAAVADEANEVVAKPGPVSKPVGGTLNGRRSGVLPITVLAEYYGPLSVQVHVDCERQQQAYYEWQRATHELLREAYFELLRAHREEVAGRAVATGVEIAGRPPAENERLVRDELKRQVIELLIGDRFTGAGAVDRAAADGRPATNLDRAVAVAPLIQFVEQAFEWDKVSYITYPYFWADADRWDELHAITGPDPAYARFLRAGSARVIVPVRPRQSGAVLYFMATGQPWGGGLAPLPDDADYVSVANEIRSLNGAPDDGSPVGGSWEVRLPTTLVALQAAPLGIPPAPLAVNAALTIPAPAGVTP